MFKNQGAEWLYSRPREWEMRMRCREGNYEGAECFLQEQGSFAPLWWHSLTHAIRHKTSYLLLFTCYPLEPAKEPCIYNFPFLPPSYSHLWLLWPWKWTFCMLLLQLLCFAVPVSFTTSYVMSNRYTTNGSISPSIWAAGCRPGSCISSSGLTENLFWWPPESVIIKIAGNSIIWLNSAFRTVLLLITFIYFINSFII